MASRKILICTGFDCGSVRVPPFEVHKDELVVVVKPDGFAETQKLMETLAGWHDACGVHILGRAEPIMPWETLGAKGSVNQRNTVWQNLQHAGIESRHVAEQLMSGLRTGLDDVLGIAHYTDKVILALRLARSRGADIVIVMGAGLDPLGTRVVLSELRNRPGAAIVVVGNNLIGDAEYEDAFDQRIDLLPAHD